MTPSFRKAIYDIPLCGETIDQQTGFVENNSGKFQILFALQELFSELQIINNRDVSTVRVTDSFGWKSNEASYQMDI